MPSTPSIWPDPFSKSHRDFQVKVSSNLEASEFTLRIPCLFRILPLSWHSPLRYAERLDNPRRSDESKLPELDSSLRDRRLYAQLRARSIASVDYGYAFGFCVRRRGSSGTVHRTRYLYPSSGNEGHHEPGGMGDRCSASRDHHPNRFGYCHQRMRKRICHRHQLQ
jgi:hypothetical protein